MLLKKIVLASCGVAGLASAAAAYALPSNCHYHSDGRVHCVYQVPTR
jgi:hypothetical protein